tara:strand:+ start:172 stop:663 length:492 start_codon:yes stop_codon:yes gene_type:complete
MNDKFESINIDIINKTNYIPYYLYIDYSNLCKDIGLGIFCKKKIEKNKFLGNYTGNVYFNKTCKIDNCKYNYSTIINNQKCIICAAKNNSNWTKYMNSSLENKLKENVIPIICSNKDTYITKDNKYINLNGYIMFYAKRDIDVGEELLFDYGEQYNNSLKMLT